MGIRELRYSHLQRRHGEETLRFAAGGGVASKISSTGTCEVQTITLDEALEKALPQRTSSSTSREANPKPWRAVGHYRAQSSENGRLRLSRTRPSMESTFAPE